ncbi:MAG: SIS domain-containing protein [Tissierellia bacterium]|nr:SIS domain-containing protein [Tissierellia bacterium]
MRKYFKNLLSIIDDSVESIDDKVFEKLLKECVETINKGSSIVVSGLGKNVPICDKFVGTMVSLGLPAKFLHTNTAVHGDMGMIQDGDLVIILSKSGETQESIYLMNLIKDWDIDLWTITFNKDSSLAKGVSSALVLELEHEGDLWNIVPNNSTTMYLIVLQGLAMQIAETKGIELKDFKRNHPGGHIGETLKNG